MGAKRKRQAGRVLRFAVSGALLVGAAGVAGCEDEPTVNEVQDEPHVNEPAMEVHTVNEPADDETANEPEPEPTVEETEEDRPRVNSPAPQPE